MIAVRQHPQIAPVPASSPAPPRSERDTGLGAEPAEAELQAAATSVGSSSTKKGRAA